MLEKTNAKKLSCHKFLKIYIPVIQLKKGNAYGHHFQYGDLPTTV